MQRLKKFFFVTFGCYLLLTVLAFMLQEKLIFLPTQLEQEYVYTFEQNFEELFLTSKDGATLNALHFKVNNPKGIILYFHGNAGDLSRWGEVTSYFKQYQYDVLVMDYRTYGKSRGELSEDALYQDAALFYDKAKELFSEDKINVYGRSLGTTFATYVASKGNPKSLVLETPFYSVMAVAKKRYWFLPVERMLKYGFPTYRYMEDVNCPVTIIHGTDDGIVPYEHGLRLYKTLPKNQINMVTIPGGSHNNLIEYAAYHDTIKSIYY